MTPDQLTKVKAIMHKKGWNHSNTNWEFPNEQDRDLIQASFEVCAEEIIPLLEGDDVEKIINEIKSRFLTGQREK